MKRVFLPGHRRPTNHFLDLFDNRSTVHLSTSVNMQRIVEHRRCEAPGGGRYAYVSYIVWAAGRALAEFPQVNAGFHRGLLGPSIGYYDRAGAKLTVDRELDGHRVVTSHLIPDADRASLAEIQDRIAYLRDTPAEELPELGAYALFRRLPVPIGRVLYRTIFRQPKLRYQAQGSFTVTSLGHRGISHFFPVISTATCFGVGAVRDEPVAERGEVVIRPLLTLSFSFDHRLIDGGLATDFLAAVKERLERYEGG
jgi:pyruvate/2-oxoglutarate dehydrogenase complex dihydrolipoamide acyltransferase (E2) component